MNCIMYQFSLKDLGLRMTMQKILHFYHLLPSTYSHLDIPGECSLPYEKHEAKCGAFLSHKEKERRGIGGKP